MCIGSFAFIGIHSRLLRSVLIGAGALVPHFSDSIFLTTSLFTLHLNGCGKNSGNVEIRPFFEWAAIKVGKDGVILHGGLEKPCNMGIF